MKFQNSGKHLFAASGSTRQLIKGVSKLRQRNVLGIIAVLLCLTGGSAVAVTVGSDTIARVFNIKVTKVDPGKGISKIANAPPAPEPKLRLPMPALAINTNLDQLQNGTSSKSPEWANGNINAQNSCYAEGDVVPYRYFVKGFTDTAQHCFTIQFEYTKAGKHAFDYLTNYDFTESGPLAALGGPCSNTSTSAPADCAAPANVAIFPDPSAFLTSTGYGGAPLSGMRQLYGYNVKDVTFDTTLGNNGYLLSGDVAGASDVALKVCFNVVDPTKSVGFFWGGHLANGTVGRWGVGNGSGSISGAPFHMRTVNFDGGGGANQDRSIQNGSICLPPQAAITTDAGPYCPGSTHTASAPNGASNYNWTVTGGIINNGQGTNSISYTVNAACGEQVKLMLTACSSTGACPGDSCCNVETIQIPVNDTQKPIITCPTDKTVECGASTAPSATGNATATDNCDTSIDISFNDVVTEFCGLSKTITRTWTATDDCGNTETCVQKITVVDTTKPSLSATPTDATVECNTVPNAPTITATDNCDTNVPVNFNEEKSGTCPTIITRTWTATDDCGNTVSHTQKLTVVDTTKPSLSATPTDATVECNTVPNAPTITATDNCDTNVPVNFNEEKSGTCPTIITRTWTATDDCGNTVSHTQKLTVVDTTKPTLNGVPANITVECDAIPAAPTITATDNCDTNVPVNFNEEKSGTCPTIITRKWTATDDCGNTVTETQQITVNDTKAPILSALPADLNLQCFTLVPAAPTITAMDSCDTSVQVDFNQMESNPGASCNNVITRKWTATDDCGNTVSHTQKITVNDTTPPVLSANPVNVEVQCLADVPTAPTITANDACAGALPVSFSELQSSPGSSCNNIITRIWSAKDSCNNEVMWTQTIKVNDTTAPNITNFPAAGVEVCSGSPVTVPSLTAMDNCNGVVPVMYMRSDGKPLADPFPLGTTTVLASAKDACNNESVKRTFTVQVKDCSQVFCSLTQGAWGNSNGKFNSEPRIETIKRLITPGSPLTIGSNDRAIKFVDGSEECLIARMPAGGSAAALPVGNLVIDANCAVPAGLLRNGRFNSVLYGQVIALSLNVRLDLNLGNKEVCPMMITAKALPGPDGKVGTNDDIPEAPGADLNLDGIPDNYLKVAIPQSVFQALTNLGKTPTVNNILWLANQALGGQNTGGASLSNINAAVDAINRGFDECRFLISCQ